MKIYTKQGDAGQTSLWGGGRVPKNHLRIQTYGVVDELNSVLGVALAILGSLSNPLKLSLLRIQNELFQLGSELATPQGQKPGVKLLEDSHIQALEKEIDEMETKLSPLKNFILPGGTHLSSMLHLARTTCRRAEREMVALHAAEPLRPETIQYLNRLSDYLFVAARSANALEGVSDVPWQKP